MRNLNEPIDEIISRVTGQSLTSQSKKQKPLIDSLIEDITMERTKSVQPESETEKPALITKSASFKPLVLVNNQQSSPADKLLQLLSGVKATQLESPCKGDGESTAPRTSPALTIKSPKTGFSPSSPSKYFSPTVLSSKGPQTSSVTVTPFGQQTI